MKKLIMCSFIGAIAFSIASLASAQIGMMGSYQNGTPVSNITSPAISLALLDIYKSQNATDLSQVVCNKITDAQFEKLGDAYMGYGITEQQHTAMEQMMGGEGSATLTQAHINMGRAYLGCWSSSNSVSMPMGGMGYYGSSGMMGWGHGPYFGASDWSGGITMILVWVLLGLGIVALIRWLRKTTH